MATKFVKATALGYYNHKRRYPGDVFPLKDDKHFSKKWMKAHQTDAPADPEEEEEEEELPPPPAKGKGGKGKKGKKQETDAPADPEESGEESESNDSGSVI